MGGKEAIRGFLYQGFATILESLTQEFWDRIYVEYPSDGDKIDIALEVNGHIAKSIQVKSSVNLFQKNDVANWIKELTSDTPADEYEVVLIGSCDKNANDFINSIVKYKNGIEDKKSEEALKIFDKTILDKHNISIKKLPIEETTLLGIVRDSLHRYISYKGYVVNFEALELLSQSVLSTQMLLGTKGNSQTKQDFDSKIFQWIELISGGLKSKKLLASHEVFFYEQKKKILSKSIDGILMNKYYNFKKHMDGLKEDCTDLIDKISSIKLGTFQRQHLEQTSSLFGDMSITGFFKIFAETKDNEKDEIINQVKSYFDIDLDHGFFFVGNLMQEKKIGVYGKYNYIYKGTKTEETKNKLLWDLKDKLLQYEVILEFIERIKRCFVLPIVVQNVGVIQDKNITIKLFLDKSVKVFHGDDYPSDGYIPIYLEMINDEPNFIESILKFKSDSKVKVGNRDSNFSFNHIKNLRKIQISDFYDELNLYIAKPQFEEDDYNIVELEVQNIRPNECIFVNKLVLLYSLDKDIEIKYKIVSDKSDGSNEGLLKVTYHDNEKVDI